MLKTSNEKDGSVLNADPCVMRTNIENDLQIGRNGSKDKTVKRGYLTGQRRFLRSQWTISDITYIVSKRRKLSVWSSTEVIRKIAIIWGWGGEHINQYFHYFYYLLVIILSTLLISNLVIKTTV